MAKNIYLNAFGIIAVLSVYALRFGGCDPIFTTEPNSGNPVYTQGSGSVSFSWDYNADGLTVDKVEWQYRKDTSATPQLIARKPTSGQSQVSAGYTGRITFSGSASLILSNIQESDSGIYECWVHFTSLATPWIISPSELIVVVSPTITLQTTQPVEITEGGSSTLLCVASGNPKPTYTWYRDSTMVQNDQAANSNYTIASATRQHAGNYRCRASVSGGGLGPFNADYTVTVTVKYKPQVDSLISNQTINDGSSAFFTCRAVGVPTFITYKWKGPNGAQISSNSKYTISSSGDSESLTVKQVQKVDAGKYSCLGSNDLGDGQEKSVFLTVRYAPQLVTITTVDLTVKEKESITLSCDADGSPTPIYSWIFNGNTLETKKELTISNAEVKDAGNYTCRAENFRGVKETTRMLNVEYKPTVTNFTTGTPNNAVVRGNKVTLTCTADGYPAPTYVIEKDGAPVTEIAEGVFEINSVQLSEENVIYSCVPTNSMGTGPKIDLRLSVQVPPRLPNAQPQLPQIKLTKTENETQSYSCTYDAKPTATIMWLLNGQNLTNTPPYNITQSFLNVPGSLKIKRTESHLRIDGVTWRQEGQFSCLGINNAGNLSQTTELEVRYRPVVQTVADHPKNVTASAGDTVVFDCKAIGNPPTEGHKWQFNGVDIPGESCTGCQSRALTRPGVTLSSAGWYSCIGWNSLGDGPPARAQLLIKHPPKIDTDDQSEYTVNETNPVTMVCRAGGVPRPDITWKKAGKNVGSGEELHINSTSEKDHGSYTCEAKNTMGDDSRQIKLNVQTRPTIVTSYPMAWNIPGDVGNPVDLSCTVKGNPTPDLSWKRDVNGTSLTPDGGNIISINKEKETIVMNIVVENIGEEYYCVAVNLLGSSHQKYVIRMRGIPDPPINLKLVGIKVIGAKTVSVNVSWTPGYDGGESQEFSIHYRKKTGTVFTIAAVGQPAGSVYTVEGLKPKTEYVFKVQAQNNLGPSEATSLAQVTTPESVLPPDRGTLKAKRVDDGTTILVTWTIEDNKVTTLNLQYLEGDGRWAPVTDATGLRFTVKPEFTVVNVNAKKIYQFRMDMRRAGESAAVYVYSEEVAAVPASGKRDDDEFPQVYIFAIVAGVAGALLILIVILCLCCFKKRKKSQGSDRVEMSQTQSCADRGPNPVHVLDNRRSYGMESVEDDPFIEAHFASQASMTATDGKKKNNDNGVNFGYMSQDSFQHQPEMLLNPGSRLPRPNGRMSQSTGELDANSAYPARGPQRDFNTLPPYHEPPSFEEAMRQSGRKPKTRKSTGDLTGQSPYNAGGPGQGRHSNRRPRQSQARPADEPTDSSDAEPRYAPHRTAPPPPRSRHIEPSADPGYAALDHQGHVMGPRVLPQGPPTGGGPRNAPLDPTVPYAVPQKKNKPKHRREEPSGAVVDRLHPPPLMYGPPSWRDSYKGWPPPQYTPDDMSPEEPRGSSPRLMRPPSDEMDLDDPSGLPLNERPPDLPPPMAMLPSNRGMPNYHDDRDDGLPEPPMFLRDGRYSPDDMGPRYDPPYQPPSPGRRQPYIDIHGRLVRPDSQASDDFRRPESLRSSRNTLSPEPEMPHGQWQPRGSESDEPGRPEINYVSYLV